MILLAAVLGPAEASTPACANATTAADIATAVAAAESAYVAMDLPGFTGAYTAAAAAVPCLREVLTPADVAGYDRLEGLQDYVGQDRPGAFAAFRAALALQPGYSLPSTIAPAGNPLDTLYQGARDGAPGGVRPVAAPPGTVAWVDGRRGVDRPADRPAIVQIVAASGEVRWSGWLDPAGPDPDWTGYADPAGVTTAAAPAPHAHRAHPARVPFAVAAGGAAVASGALYALALSTRATFDDPDTPLADVDGLRDRANTEVWASAGTAILAVGLGTVVVFTARW